MILIRVYCSKGVRKKNSFTGTRPCQSDRKMATSSKEVRCSSRSFKQVIMLLCPNMPVANRQSIRTLSLRLFADRVDDGKNWKVFDFCNMFLQTAKELEEATSDLLQRLRMENVTYAEIRFCPQLHTLESLTSEEALLAVIKGIF